MGREDTCVQLITHKEPHAGFEPAIFRWLGLGGLNCIIVPCQAEEEKKAFLTAHKHLRVAAASQQRDEHQHRDCDGSGDVHETI